MRINTGKYFERGTTLAEVVMATAILAFSFAGIMGTIFSGFFIMERTRENQRATQILLEKVETLRLYNWSQVTDTNFIPATFTQVFDPQSTNASGGITYFGTFKIDAFPHATSYNAKMRQVTVNLSWTSKHNLQRTRSLVTYIAQDGVQNYVY